MFGVYIFIIYTFRFNRVTFFKTMSLTFGIAFSCHFVLQVLHLLSHRLPPTSSSSSLPSNIESNIEHLLKLSDACPNFSEITRAIGFKGYNFWKLSNPKLIRHLRGLVHFDFGPKLVFRLGITFCIKLVSNLDYMYII